MNIIWLAIAIPLALWILNATLGSWIGRGLSRLRLRRKRAQFIAKSPLDTHDAIRRPDVPASPELQAKLIRLFDGDRQRAEEFVAEIRLARYGKSEAYYWALAVQRKQSLDRTRAELRSGQSSAASPKRAMLLEDHRRPPLATAEIHFPEPDTAQGADSDARKVELHLQNAADLAKQRKFEPAQTILRRLIRDRPDCARAYLLRGRIHRDLGQTDDAIDDFDRAIALQPKNPAAYREKGMAEHDSRNYHGPIASLSVALGNFPSAVLLTTRASAYKGIGQDAEALVDYQRAQQLYAQRGAHLQAKRLQKQINALEDRAIRKQLERRISAPQADATEFPFRQGSAPLRKQLLSLVDGDRPRAQRLLASIRSRHPRKTIT